MLLRVRATLRAMNPFANLVETFPFLSILPPLAVLGIVIAAMAWTLVIKGFALWFAARNKHLAWFIVLMLVNTLGILELAYLLIFRKEKVAHETAVAGTTETA